jgi:hypothetical protein
MFHAINFLRHLGDSFTLKRFGLLLQHRYAHRDMEPIYPMFTSVM